MPAFQSAAARLSIGRNEHQFYVGVGVPHGEAVRFRLKDVALREPPPSGMP